MTQELFREILSAKRLEILRGGTWVVFGQATVGVATVLGTRILTGLANPAVFGTLSLLLGVSALGQSLFALPFLHAAIRFFPDLSRRDHLGSLRFVLRRYLTWSSFSLAGLFLVLGVSSSFTKLHITYWSVVLLAGLLVVEVWRGGETSLLAAAGRQREYSLWNSVDAILRPSLAVAAIVLIGSTPEAILLGYLVAVVCSCSFFSILFRAPSSGRRGDISDESRLSKAILSYAGPLIPLGLMSWISNLGSRYVIGAMLGTAPVGMYSATFGLVSAPFLQIQGMVELTLRPAYYEAVSRGEDLREASIIRFWLATVAILCFVTVVLIFVFREGLATLLLAKEYREGADLMPWVAGGYAMLAISYVFARKCYAYGKTGWVVLIEFIGAFSTIVSAIPLVHFLGIKGVAIAVPIAFAMQLLASIVAYRLLTKARKQ